MFLETFLCILQTYYSNFLIDLIFCKLGIYTKGEIKLKKIVLLSILFWLEKLLSTRFPLSCQSPQNDEQHAAYWWFSNPSLHFTECFLIYTEWRNCGWTDPSNTHTSEGNCGEEIATWVNDFQEKHRQIHHYNIVCLLSKERNIPQFLTIIMLEDEVCTEWWFLPLHWESLPHCRFVHQPSSAVNNLSTYNLINEQRWRLIKHNYFQQNAMMSEHLSP